MKASILIKAALSLTLLLSLAARASVASGQTNERESVLKACEDLFGKSVDVKENLFEVNELYVVQVKFDSAGKLTSLGFFPKHYLNETHPEWEEPEHMVYLKRDDYENLLERLDRIKFKGKLIKSVENAAVTNSTYYFLDQYEHAFMQRLEYDRLGVRLVNLSFFNEIKGKVRKKRKFSYSGIERDIDSYYSVIVGECLYLTDKDTFQKLRVGRTTKFQAAGPFKNFRGGYDCAQ